jgi:hypothetical protein
MRRRASPHWRSCVGPSDSSAPDAPGSWLIIWRLDRGFSSAPAWLIGQDKRGVSALFLARELALRYDTAWLMAHKLRHGLSERPEYPLDGLIEIDESYYGGRGKPESRGRGLTDPNKSLMAIAVETVPAQAAARPREASSILRGRPPHLPTGSGEWRSPLVAGSSEPG